MKLSSYNYTINLYFLFYYPKQRECEINNRMHMPTVIFIKFCNSLIIYVKTQTYLKIILHKSTQYFKTVNFSRTNLSYFDFDFDIKIYKYYGMQILIRIFLPRIPFPLKTHFI